MTITVSLTDKLTFLNWEQLEAMFSIYSPTIFNAVKDGDPETLINKLAELIETKPNSEVLDLLDEYCTSFTLENTKLQMLTVNARKATKLKNEFKKTHSSTIATFTQDLLTFVPAEELQRLQAKKQMELKQAEFKRREKKRQSALKSYLQSVALAVVDEVEEEYTEDTQTKTIEVLKKTKSMITAGRNKDKGFDPKTKSNATILASSVIKTVKMKVLN